MTSPMAFRSGGPPALAFMTAAISRKYAEPRMPGVMTASVREGEAVKLSKRWTAPRGMKRDVPGVISCGWLLRVMVREPSRP